MTGYPLKRVYDTILAYCNNQSSANQIIKNLKTFFWGGGWLRPVKIFTHFEPSHSLGGAKTGDPREKPPDHPQAELGLSHMHVTRARL